MYSHSPPSGLEAWRGVLSAAEVALAEALVADGQGGIFERWAHPDAEATPSKVHRFFEQVREPQTALLWPLPCLCAWAGLGRLALFLPSSPGF